MSSPSERSERRRTRFLGNKAVGMALHMGDVLNIGIARMEIQIRRRRDK